VDNNLNIAVLIDGDNISSTYIGEMIEEVSKYGNPTIKRIYGTGLVPDLQNGKNLFSKMLSLRYNNTDIPRGKTQPIQR